MIFMSVLPTSGLVQHSGGGYPPIKDLWATVKSTLMPLIGCDLVGRYNIQNSFNDNGFVLVRSETGSTVKITRSKVEKTYAR